MRHHDLTTAKNDKRDEFYTQRVDIETEMSFYPDVFRNKTVYLPCDDVRFSEFWFYFRDNFERLGLRKLIATHLERGGCSSVTTMTPYNDGFVCHHEKFSGDGDFRSDECLALMQEADIVVTNPPFSLFREFVAVLMQYGKQFLILGNMNATSYKEIFPLIQHNQLWLGASIHSGDRIFRVPKDYPLTAANCYEDDDGNRFVRVKSVRWFTNLDYLQRPGELALMETYDPSKYIKYDNADAINVDKTALIPKDYDGLMGVPLTFLDKYNPEQFEIIRFRKGDDDKDLVYTKDGKRVQPYFRILIRRRKDK